MKIGTILKKACDSNHLRLMFAPIILDGEERRTEKGNCTKLNITISRADIHEILGENILPILDFYRKDSTTVIADKPEVSINMEKTFYVLKSSMGRQFVAPRLNFTVTLGNGKLDFDISIFDRLHTLFSSPFAQYMSDGAYEQDHIEELTPSSQKIVQSKSKIKIQSSCMNLIVRFPIVDMRPLHDPDRLPWWQRNVRQDFLLIKFIDFQLNIISPCTYDVVAHDITVLYHESEKSQPVTIARALPFENKSKYYSTSPDYPRIVIQVPTENQLQELNENFIREQCDGKSDDTDSDPTSASINANLKVVKVTLHIQKLMMVRSRKLF
jgi:autophagy-related protein 2